MRQIFQPVANVAVLYTESRWELPVSSAQADVADVAPAEIAADHTDRPPAAKKKKKAAEDKDVRKVVHVRLIREIDLIFNELMPGYCCTR